MSSLFGNLNNTQKSDYGGLFGGGTPASSAAPAGSTPAPGGGLGGLGGLGGGGSLFGTPKTAAGGGLFPAATSGAGAGGLFGGSTSAAPKPGGLFGSSTTTGSGTSGLFGTAASSGGQQTSSTAGTTAGAQSTSTAAGAGGGLFTPLGGSTWGAKTGSTAQSTGLPSDNLSGSTAVPQSDYKDMYFESILENSKKRPYRESISEDLPQLQLGLGDLRQRIKRLGAGVQDKGLDGRAHYLLAASGVNPGAAVKDLHSFAAATGRFDKQPRVEELVDTDVESYLTNLQTQTTLSMIQDGLARSVRDFDAFLEENVNMEWEAQRKRIYEHFGIRPKEGAARGGGSFAASAGQTGGGFGRSRRSKGATLAASRASTIAGESFFGGSNLGKSVIGASAPVGSGNQPLFTDVEKRMEANGVPLSGPQDRFQREKQHRFADKVQELNLARLKKEPFPICAKFIEVVQQSAEQHGPDLIKAYRALMEIVGETPEVKNMVDVQTKERGLAGDYLDESPNSVRTSRIRKTIIRGGAKVLEKLAFEKMEDLVARNPREAELGGVPNITNKIKAYVRLQAIKKNLYGDNSDLQRLGDDYVWAIIYFFIRTGHITEAVEYVNNNLAAFRAIDRNFSAYIHDYSNSDDRRLSPDNQTRISNEYNQRLRIAPASSVDPYRMACYKIIGRCDLRVRTLADIKQDIEDFAWVQLVLARELSRVDAMASEVYGLLEAQKTVGEIGNRFFAKGGAEIGSSFGAFVFLQLAVGMFEDAVSYLYTYSYMDGVHLAIALDLYGLLRVSDPAAGVDELLSLSTKGLPQINFGRMVGLYTRDFRAANVSAAADYLTLICLNRDLPGQGGLNQVDLCHSALRELALESREFTLLLGDMRDDGQRIKGAIEERKKLIGLDEADEFMRNITMQAASSADDNGRVTDAVLLWHLAGEYDTVMTVVNRALGEAVAIPFGQEPMKIQPIKPRAQPNNQQQEQEQEGAHSSLTSVDDPIMLGRIIYHIYRSQAMYSAKLKPVNMDSCATLLRMAEAKTCILAGDYPNALDIIKAIDILPTQARGNAAIIRSYANKFSALSQPVASNVPNLLQWAIGCCEQQLLSFSASQFGGNDGVKQQIVGELKQLNMDMVTYSSQMRYRLPAHIHEALARAQAD